MRHEPLDILMAAAIEALKPTSLGLRERGWDARIMVHAADVGQRTVALEISLEAAVPVEYSETA